MKFKKLNLDNLKKLGSILIISSTLMVNPVSANTIEKSEITTDTSIDKSNYVILENKNYYNYAIKLNGKTAYESFCEKAKFLLGEEVYNNQYLTGKNINELKTKFDTMYGSGSFLKLKEFEYKTKGLNQSEINTEYINLALAYDYEIKQNSIFPNSSIKEERQNTITNLKINLEAIKNVIDDNQSMYNTLYDMNEFVSKSLGNASQNLSIDNFRTVWDLYKNEIMDKVVVLVNIYGEKTVEMDAIDLGKYNEFNKIEHNPVTYNLIQKTKNYKLR